jgi:hypothetical protein
MPRKWLAVGAVGAVVEAVMGWGQWRIDTAIMAERGLPGMHFLGIGGLPTPQRSSLPDSNLDSCGKLAAALDNAIEKYYLRFHDCGDAG